MTYEYDYDIEPSWVERLRERNFAPIPTDPEHMRQYREEYIRGYTVNHQSERRSR